MYSLSNSVNQLKDSETSPEVLQGLMIIHAIEIEKHNNEFLSLKCRNFHIESRTLFLWPDPVSYENCVTNFFSLRSM